MSTPTSRSRNRDKILADIIYSMNSFKASTVIRRFRARTGSTLMGLFESVQDRLNTLVEFGAIREIGDRYIVRSR